MERDRVTAILEEYDTRCELYSLFTPKVEQLIRDLLSINNLRVHSITSRVKTRESLHEKVKSDEKYSTLNDLSDTSGIRIITFFSDDVDDVAEVIQNELEIIPAHSIDQREMLDPDRFGYLSLHYVVKLSSSRLRLTEYQNFKDCQTEIQIRSILQHAWAEIEHDLGYKSKQSIPREVRRRFSRLASLLEIADTEFDYIRETLQSYAKTVPQKIVEEPALVEIDKISLLTYIKNNPLNKKLDKAIADLRNAELIEPGDFNLNLLIKILQYNDLKTIADMVSNLDKYQEYIIPFAKIWSARASAIGKLMEGVSIFYLCHVLIGRKQSVTETEKYFTNMGIPTKALKEIAERLVETYSKVEKIIGNL